MTHNDLLRRLRYALNLNNAALLDIFKLSDCEMKPAELNGLLRKEDEDGFIPCSDEIFTLFLDGLITYKRGKRQENVGAIKPHEPLHNNLILKKLRIALELKEEDMLSVLKGAGFPVSKSELSALFRAKGQPNYKACGDQLLRNFVKGLALRYREKG